MDRKTAEMGADAYASHDQEQNGLPPARRLRVLLDDVPVMVGYWDSDRRNRLANAAYGDSFTVDPGKAYGRHMSELLGAETYEANRPQVEGALSGERQSFERATADSRGELQHTQSDYFPDSEDGVTHGFFVLTNDITAQKKRQEDLERLAMHDVLTGLLNRRGLYGVLETECSRYDRYEQATAVMVLDLDRFKQLNDDLGHLAGDHALVEVARILKGRFRSGDHVARQGGDEFAAVLLGASVPEAEAVGREICRLIAGAQLGAAGVHVSASIGVTALRQKDTAIDLIARADTSMYEAKRQGGNSISSLAV
jgi:diguanylate cyclase (GGDEF)-like protein/PAS domain S-box-containing protein